jgi:hypothetical protein
MSFEVTVRNKRRHCQGELDPAGFRDHLGLLTLVSDKTRPNLVLAPLQGPDKVQWDFTTRSNQPMTAEEASAFARLSAKLATQSNGTQVQVTGPLKKNGTEFFLEVREFKV